MANTTRNPFGWVEIYVDDMGRAQLFYETILQQKLIPAELPKDCGDLQMLFFPFDEQWPNISGALCKTSQNKPGPGGTMVYIACQDCALELSRVLAAGGQILQGKEDIAPFGFCAIMQDTEGNHVGLHSMQ
jgi:uncharacterized protein